MYRKELLTKVSRRPKEPDVRIETETVNEDVVPYNTERIDTDELPLGEEEVVQTGVNGYTKVTYEVRYEDDVEVGRTEVNREVVAPVDEIINVGTMVVEG